MFKKRVKPCTCDCIHLLLRWRIVICHLSERRERRVGVQVQTQHEIMYLVGKKKGKESVSGVHLHNLSRPQVSMKWTYQSTLPARPSLVLNNAESLKSDVNIRWPQLAWAVRWYSSSASVFSLPPEHERYHQTRHQNETQRISPAECANYVQVNRLNL